PPPRPARLYVRTGSGDRRGRGAPAVAGPGGPDAPPLARAGRGDVLRHLLLCIRDALLSGTRALGPRRPHPDAKGAGALPLLARLGARPDAPGPLRDRRRPRVALAARPLPADRVHRLPLRDRRRPGDPAPAPLRSEQLAELPGEPQASRRGAPPRPSRARAPNLRA